MHNVFRSLNLIENPLSIFPFLDNLFAFLDLGFPAGSGGGSKPEPCG